jgi:Mg-chelatase subunit ChlD
MEQSWPGPNGTGNERHRPARRALSHAILAALGAALGALLEGWPDNLLGWLTVAAAALVGALFSLSALADYLDARAVRLLRRLRPSRPLRLRRLLPAAVALLLSVAFGRSLVAVGGEAAGWVAVRVSGCPAATELRLLTTPEGRTAADAVAEEYTLWTARDNHDCPAVRVHVYAAPHVRALEALRSGWQTNWLAELGPRPDLWLPGASRHTLASPDLTSNGLLEATESASLGTTPVVLAVPAAAVPEELRAGRTAMTWAELLDVVRRRTWGLVRPNPAVSMTGEYATVAMYASGDADPEPPDGTARTSALVGAEAARRIETRVARTLDQGGYPLGDAVDLLCRQRSLDGETAPGDGTTTPGDGAETGQVAEVGQGAAATTTALVITEQQLVQFNAGMSLGGRCPATASPVEQSLLAVYPTDTLSLDEPLVTLRWRNQPSERAEQVDSFRRWLTDGAGRDALSGVGLRTPGSPAGDPVSERYGALPGVVLHPQVRPGEDDFKAADKLRRDAQRPGRVLLLLDASGSMREPAAMGGQTRFDLAVRAAAGLTARLGAGDEVGIWAFQGRDQRPEPLVPIGAPTSPERIDERLAAVSPGGATPLHRAVVAGLTAVGPAGPERASALVVLTDGTDEGSGITAAQMLAKASGSDVRVFVVAVGSARCTPTAIRQLIKTTGGACYETNPADVDSRLGMLSEVLWEGTDP